MKIRMAGLWAMFCSFIQGIFGSLEDEFWDEFLERAEAAHQAGNDRYIAAALSSELTVKSMRRRIVEMLFLPEVPKPEWLTFEHVINDLTPHEAIRFVAEVLEELKVRSNYALDNAHTRQFAHRFGDATRSLAVA